jgi:hypothetical protein
VVQVAPLNEGVGTHFGVNPKVIVSEEEMAHRNEAHVRTQDTALNEEVGDHLNMVRVNPLIKVLSVVRVDLLNAEADKRRGDPLLLRVRHVTGLGADPIVKANILKQENFSS